MTNIFYRLEYGVAFLIILYMYFKLDFPLWILIVFILVPDVSMFGYLFNNKVGSIVYNIGHSPIIPLFLLAVEFITNIEALLLISFIWLAHIAMDRLCGFGLKYKNSFKETHMQKV